MPRRYLPYKLNPQTLREEAWCKHCLQVVAFINVEALCRYPDQAYPVYNRPAVHNCPCTCEDSPYTCPVGRALVSAIQERKGNQ